MFAPITFVVTEYKVFSEKIEQKHIVQVPQEDFEYLLYKVLSEDYRKLKFFCYTLK